MGNELRFGQAIRDRRLSLNLRMEDVARQSGITRTTLWSIEKGKTNCSVDSLISVLTVLGLSLELQAADPSIAKRLRATRVTTAKKKRINRFIVMCVEQYAASVDQSSREVYAEMKKAGLIDILTKDYEDLHGLSTMALNDYIGMVLDGDVRSYEVKR